LKILPLVAALDVAIFLLFAFTVITAPASALPVINLSLLLTAFTTGLLGGVISLTTILYDLLLSPALSFACN